MKQIFKRYIVNLRNILLLPHGGGWVGGLSGVALLVSCTSDIPVQHSDDYGYITFAVKAQQPQTRTNDYEAYDASKHPVTMGVMGYANGLTETVFSNDIATYNAASGVWSTNPQKRWDAYKGKKTFDFFAYMPQTENATVMHSETDNTYTLSVPFTTTDGSTTEEGTTTGGILLDVKKAPIICALPAHRYDTDAETGQLIFDRVIDLRFDQALTGYRLLFTLGEKMGAIRNFVLRTVTVSGELAASGTVSRTYKQNNDEWTAQDILWTDIERKNVETEIKNGDSKASLTLTYSKDADGNDIYQQWGTDFYAIPDDKFTPTITVTYDVVFTAEDGTTVTTRQDVTSTITLNKSNFEKLAKGGIGKINPIRILIEPRYLYVLSDDDAYSGHLLIE